MSNDTNQELKKYAEEYLELHNERIQKLWEGDEIEFFQDMLGGLHGNIHHIDEKWCEVEISGIRTDSGNPALLTFPSEFLV